MSVKKNMMELLKVLPEWSCRMRDSENLLREVHALSHDSRTLEAGDVFIAVRGFESDGHRYLTQAEKAGALALVVEEEKEGLSIPQIKVPDARLAQSLLAAAFYDHPSRKLRLCGITGSNGKTSTSLMYRSILEHSDIPCGLIGTVQYQSGKSTIASTLTTPDSIDLQRYLREMLEADYREAVMEVSSIALDQKRTAGTEFSLAAFINLGREHLDYHKSMENYFAAKASLFQNMKDESIAVINADDAYGKRLSKMLKQPQILFGFSEEADVRAIDLDLSTGFARFRLQLAKGMKSLTAPIPSGTYPIQLKVAGSHSVMNALAAIALGLADGLDPEACIRGIEAYGGVERRFQEIYHGDFRVFDDHFANPGNIERTLETLAAMDYRHLWIIYAIRGNRGVGINREMILSLGPWIQKLRLAAMVSSLSRDVTGHYNWVHEEEFSAYESAMREIGLEAACHEQLESAICSVLERVEPGDVILLAGCQGMDAGARLLLGELAERCPERKEEILAPLRDRVCGFEPV